MARSSSSLSRAFRIVCSLIFLGIIGGCYAQSCNHLLPPYTPPKVATGWKAQLVSQNLVLPRSLRFDTAGNLIVVEQSRGITSLAYQEDDKGCIIEMGRKAIINDTSLNHAVEFSADGKTIYASSRYSVFAWSYDATVQANTSAPVVIVHNMNHNGLHTTRSLHRAKSVPNTLVVQYGASANLDPLAADLQTGIGSVKAFKLTSGFPQPQDYLKDGLLLGWGLRNAVGIAEHPRNGNLYGLENGISFLNRSGVSIEFENPADELNLLGPLPVLTTVGRNIPPQIKNFGFPKCHTAWNVGTIPNNAGLSTGSPIAGDNLTLVNNDLICKATTRAASLSFPAHTAPLGLEFDNAGTKGWIAFHGSFRRTPPIGYKVSYVEMNPNTGLPKKSPSSNDATVDILTAADINQCIASTDCLRPVGLQVDKKGRLWVSSDSTGEIWVISKS